MGGFAGMQVAFKPWCMRALCPVEGSRISREGCRSQWLTESVQVLRSGLESSKDGPRTGFSVGRNFQCSSVTHRGSHRPLRAGSLQRVQSRDVFSGSDQVERSLPANMICSPAGGQDSAHLWMCTSGPGQRGLKLTSGRRMEGEAWTVRDLAAGSARRWNVHCSEAMFEILGMS